MKIVRISFDQFLILLLLLSITWIPFIFIGFDPFVAVGAFASSQIILISIGIFYFIVGAVEFLEGILFKKSFVKDKARDAFKKSMKCLLCLGVYWFLYYAIAVIAEALQ